METCNRTRRLSTGGRLTEAERECIRLSAQTHSVKSLAELMGRDPHTVTAWARANGVTFGRVPRKPFRRVSRKPLKRDGSARIERMMALAFRSAA